MVSANPSPSPAYHLGGVEASPSVPTRLLSLDLFRGITIAAMILVNNAGNEDAAYWPLKHAAWNGWSPTDLIFPFFLFIVGVSLVYSTDARLQRGQSRTALWTHAVRRACVLFAVGVCLNGFPNDYHLASLRIEGVLQRIAVCYLVAAALVLWTHPRVQVLIAAACLAGYWILMRSFEDRGGRQCLDSATRCFFCQPISNSRRTDTATGIIAVVPSCAAATAFFASSWAMPISGWVKNACTASA